MTEAHATSAPASATTSPRPWLMQYPPGVPGTVAVDSYASLVPLLEESWTTHAARDAAACMGVRITYGQVDERSKALGAWLQAQGVRRGDNHLRPRRQWHGERQRPAAHYQWPAWLAGQHDRRRGS